MRIIHHNYQLTAISKILTNKRLALFLDPGLGKTAITLSSIRILKHTTKFKGVLIVAPLLVCFLTWPNEIKKWENYKGLSHCVLHGKGKSKLWEDRDIYIINPQGLPWLYKELLIGLKAGKELPFDILWVDESTKFKNPTGSFFTLLKDMLSLFKRVYIMTGTPIPKSYLDLWSQIYLLDKGLSLEDNFYHYRNKYFHREEYNNFNFTLNDFAEDIITERISKLVLNMSEDDYLELQKPIYTNIELEIPESKKKQYKKLQSDLFVTLSKESHSAIINNLNSIESDLPDEIIANSSADLSLKCQQYCNGRIYENIPEEYSIDELKKWYKTRKSVIIHREKEKALLNLVEELNGKTLMVVYHFENDLIAIKEALKSVHTKIEVLGKGVTLSKARSIERRWNEKKIRILCVQPGSMAHGLNFQKGGNHICFYSLTWNYENYYQVLKRLWRQGANKATMIYYLTIKNSIEKLILDRLTQRNKTQFDFRKSLKEIIENV